MKPLRGILFDKDGTILDYWKTWIPINRAVATMAANGDQTLADALLRHGGHDPMTDQVTPGSVLAAASMDGIIAAFAAYLGPRAPKTLAQETSRLFREGGAANSVMIDGAAEALRSLKARGFRLGVATNDSIDGLHASLGKHAGLLDLFEFHCGCDSGHGSKPEPGMGRAFCDALGLDPRATAIVGDSTHDLEMGVRAGYGVRVAVLSGTGRKEDLAPYADVVVTSVAELPRHPWFSPPAQ
jgi:phosphoglycolate phosphatase